MSDHGGPTVRSSGAKVAPRVRFSPQPSGTAITWTAIAIGSIPPIQYRFEREDGGVWNVVQAYGTSSTYTWNPASGDAGDHAVRVSVRNAGSVADFEDTRTLAMTITSGSGMAVPSRREASLLAALHPSHWLMRLFARPAPPVSLTVTERPAESRRAAVPAATAGRPRPTVLLATIQPTGERSGAPVDFFTTSERSDPSGRTLQVRPDLAEIAAASPHPPDLQSPAARRLRTSATAGPGDIRRYSLYTPEMNLLAETAESAASPPMAYEYVWFNGHPVAQVDAATSTTRWTYTDHLGTPIAQTDAGGAIAWRAEYEPYGNVQTIRTGSSLHQPLRFPGQEGGGDGEREYNIYRWYRSGWGRYSQADTVGLAGGMNLFGYVVDDPISHADPLGLVTWSQTAPVVHAVDWDTVYWNCLRDWEADGCTRYHLHADCSCRCSSGRSYRASVSLSLTIDVWTRNDHPRVPLSLIIHEEMKHVRYVLVSFRWARQRGERLEAKTFLDERACKSACKDFYAETKHDFEQFESWVHEHNPHPY